MEVGDLVRWRKRDLRITSGFGVIVSEIRHGANSSFIDVLVDGKIIPVNFLVLEVISETQR